MKKIIFCLAVLIVSNSVYSQQTNPPATMTKKDYLQKSKNQKTAAWILMGGGLGVTILGLTNEKSDDNKSDNTGKGVAIVTGLAAISVSTTLFIVATNNKKKGEALSFKMEKAPQLQQGSLVNRYFPALTYKFNL